MATISCPAKINLYLRILGKLPDGYHQLETLFQTIDLADSLHFHPGSGPLLEVIGADVGPLEQNLVVHAARAFAAAAGMDIGGGFRLEKRIPAGGGLGGGSSDAAGALRLLNQHHGSPLSHQQLIQIAAGLGSDIPFFLEGGCRLGSGRGTQLQPAEPGTVHRRGFLLCPPFGLATAAVYGAYRHEKAGEARVGHNDLLPAALTVSQPFRRLYQTLAATLSTRGCFFMTGSGSTCVWLTEETAPDHALTALFRENRMEYLPFSFLEP